VFRARWCTTIFPQLKYLEELEVNELPKEGQIILPTVETLDFIKEGRSIIMYGNPGTGKTHIAIGLGIKACLQGYSVYFTSVPETSDYHTRGKNGQNFEKSLQMQRYKKNDIYKSLLKKKQPFSINIALAPLCQIDKLRRQNEFGNYKSGESFRV
jgi:hypothetical protein